MDWMRSARTMSEVRRRPHLGASLWRGIHSFTLLLEAISTLDTPPRQAKYAQSHRVKPVERLQIAHHVFGSGPCQEAAGSVSPPPSHPTSILSHSKLQTTDLQATYSNYKNTLQQIAQKIGDIEQEAEEHKYAHPPSPCIDSFTLQRPA